MLTISIAIQMYLRYFDQDSQSQSSWSSEQAIHGADWSLLIQLSYTEYERKPNKAVLAYVVEEKTGVEGF